MISCATRATFATRNAARAGSGGGGRGVSSGAVGCGSASFVTLAVLGYTGGHDHGEPADDDRPITPGCDGSAGEGVFIHLPGERGDQERGFRVLESPMRPAADAEQVEGEPDQAVYLGLGDGQPGRLELEAGPGGRGIPAGERAAELERRKVGHRKERDRA